MARLSRSFFVGLVMCVVASCDRRIAESPPTAQSAGPAGLPPPVVTPTAPLPQHSGNPSLEQEASALKALGVWVELRETISVKLEDDNLTKDGRIKPEILVVLIKTTNLSELNFQFARAFSDAGAEEIQDFTNLRKLVLQGTEITDNGLAFLKRMTKLNDLYLSYTKITDAGLAHLKGLTELTTLSLGSGASIQVVSDAGLSHLRLGKLKELHISGSHVTDAGLELLKDSKELGVLWANDCEITDKGLGHLKPLTKLSWLKLDRTKVTDSGLANLNQMKLLSSLDLDYCRGVGEKALSHLQDLYALKYLSVKGTAITKESAAKLQAKIPNCTIFSEEWELKGK